MWAITFPDEKEFTDEIPESFINLSKPTEREPEGKTEKINQGSAIISSGMLGWLGQNIEKYFSGFELGIISCKTPWNDFAVIPEHWDLVYALSQEMPEALEIKKITIAKDSSFLIGGLKKFFYAFATLPSQDPSKFSNPKTLPIIRLKQLTGGNYWGLPSQTGVQSIKEIFEKNFLSSIENGHLANLKKELSKLKTDYSYFGI